MEWSCKEAEISSQKYLESSGGGFCPVDGGSPPRLPQGGEGAVSLSTERLAGGS